MEVLDGREDLCCEVPSLILAELALVAHYVEQLAAIHVVHQHVDLRCGVEGEVQLDEEGVVQVLQDESLGDGLQLGALLDQLRLADYFHRVDLA